MTNPTAPLEDEELESLLGDFLDESEELLGSLGGDLKHLGNHTTVQQSNEPYSCDEQLLNRMFRSAHSLKGLSAMLGLGQINALTHRMENVFDAVRNGQLFFTADSVELLLDSIDCLMSMVENLRDEYEQPVQCDHVITGIEDLLKSIDASTGSNLPREADLANGGNCLVPSAIEMIDAAEISCPPGGIAEQIEALLAQVVAKAPPFAKGFAGCVHFTHDTPLIGLKATLLVHKLSALGNVFYTDPPREALEGLAKQDPFLFGVQTDRDMSRIRRVLEIAGVRNVALLPLSQRIPPCEVGTEDEFVPSQAVAHKPIETLRVEVTHLDQLMQMADQLIDRHARLVERSEELRTTASAESTSQLLADLQPLLENVSRLNEQQEQRQVAALVEAAVRIQDKLPSAQQAMAATRCAEQAANELVQISQQCERIGEAIRKTILETRLVSMKPLFTRVRRVIREITRSKQTQINVAVHGEQIKLDKRIIDQLCEPLVHIARNAADHGIEHHHERSALGKSTQGTVSLEALLCHNSIYIRISDDGRGLDANKILTKAIGKGLVGETEARQQSPQQIYSLVWEPGFSTAEAITDVSGRGMGMDIAKSKIEGLNGSVDLDSMPGEGTTFTIKLPLALAMVPSLHVESGGLVFAVPIESVVETVRIPQLERHALIDSGIARVQDRIVPLVQLPDLLPGEQRTEGLNRQEDDQTLLILGAYGEEAAVVADRLLGEEDVAIRPATEFYRKVPGISGASVRSDGRMSFILDVGCLCKSASKS